MADSSSQEFRRLLMEHRTTEGAAEKLVLYRELVLKENEAQNLTRLLSPRDFFEGHMVDCIELVKSGLLDHRMLDLGSGVGVPGVPCAILEPHTDWVLCESEGRKADFLTQTGGALGLLNVRVFRGRAENWLATNSRDTIIARAVGPVGRIFGWIGKCSTWNNLLLLKGKGWEQEWVASQIEGIGENLRKDSEYSYKGGEEDKRRVIVKLGRKAQNNVPRRTQT